VNRPIPTPGAVTGTTSTEDVVDWRARAACVDADPELFFGDGDMLSRTELEKAAAYCNRCPVWDVCMEDAKVTDVRYGVRAGRDMYRGRRPGRKQRFDVTAA
jgi:WhiB family redox-sensing transcriptional regulator